MEEFRNRLVKVMRHWGKWARRQGITCYRIYDDDLTNYPFAIDRYGDALYVAEYQRRHRLSEEEHQGWLAQCLQVLQDVFSLPPEQIFLKQRQRQKGQQQYQKLATERNRRLVNEGGLQFWVNLSDYLDTGLFLDHRQTRQLVRGEAAGKRMVNLFAYTGSFSVYAASGGARTTTTVDLSATYLDWAADNFALNGYSAGPALPHQLVRADATRWLAALPPNAFDLAVLDPPTFSNSKSMLEVLEIQRDHVALLNHLLAALTPGGVVYFSTNYRSFKLAEADLRASEIRNISTQTIPPDFSDKKIHQCYRLVK